MVAPWSAPQQGPQGRPRGGLWAGGPPEERRAADDTPAPGPEGSGPGRKLGGPGSRLMARLLQPNSSNDNIQSITSGDWDVTKILSYDEKRNKM